MEIHENFIIFVHLDLLFYLSRQGLRTAQKVTLSFTYSVSELPFDFGTHSKTYTRSDEKTRPDKQKDNHKYKDNDDDKYI